MASTPSRGHEESAAPAMRSTSVVTANEPALTRAPFSLRAEIFPEAVYIGSLFTVLCAASRCPANDVVNTSECCAPVSSRRSTRCDSMLARQHVREALDGALGLLAGARFAEHERDADGRQLVARLVPPRRAELALREIEHDRIALLDEALRRDEDADAELLDHLGDVGGEHGHRGRAVPQSSIASRASRCGTWRSSCRRDRCRRRRASSWGARACARAIRR